MQNFAAVVNVLIKIFRCKFFLPLTMNLPSTVLASLWISFVMTATNPIISHIPTNIYPIQVTTITGTATPAIAIGKRIADVIEKIEKRLTSLPSADLKKNDQKRKRKFALPKSGNKESIFQWINMGNKEDQCMGTSFNASWGLDLIENKSNATQESDLQNNASSSDTILLRPKLSGKRTPISGTPTTDRPYMCSLQGCHRAFQRSYSLEIHKRVHTGEQSFKCDFPNCQKSFFRPDNLNSHFKTYTREQPFKCRFPGCQKSFSRIMEI